MTSRTDLHRAIDELGDDQLNQVTAIVENLLARQSDPVWERLRRIPGIELPAHWPPRFRVVSPLKIEGELPSERLIRERR